MCRSRAGAEPHPTISRWSPAKASTTPITSAIPRFTPTWNFRAPGQAKVRLYQSKMRGDDHHSKAATPTPRSKSRSPLSLFMVIPRPARPLQREVLQTEARTDVPFSLASEAC